MPKLRPLRNEVVVLEPAGADNVELLVKWTLDPVAQGPYKRVPEMTPELCVLYVRKE
ncbi:MAG: hypothetical protein JXA14_02830 [Anaerolineae bacterium]|nr:hypothetical protein [Anaerolineae bacterium]